MAKMTMSTHPAHGRRTIFIKSPHVWAPAAATMYERPPGAIRPDEIFFLPGRAQWALVQTFFLPLKHHHRVPINLRHRHLHIPILDLERQRFLVRGQVDALDVLAIGPQGDLHVS